MIFQDVVYAQYGDRQLKLDVYQPPADLRQHPVPGIIVVRGGAFREGDKAFFGYVAGRLALEGFVAASIEYRTSDEAKFPAAVHDAKAAVRWLRAHAAEYDVNPDEIGAIGGSAGAYFVTMLGTTAGVREFEGAGGNAGISSEVQAVVSMACGCSLQWKEGASPEFMPAVSDFIGAPLTAERLAAASPTTYVSRSSAPLLLLHSRTDPDVPFEYSVEMEHRYRRAGAPVMLIPIDAPGVHAFWSGAVSKFDEAKRLAAKFFRIHLKVSK